MRFLLHFCVVFGGTLVLSQARDNFIHDYSNNLPDPLLDNHRDNYLDNLVDYPGNYPPPSSSAESMQERQSMDKIIAEWKWETVQDFEARKSPRGGPSNDPDDVYFSLYTNPKDRNDFDLMPYHDSSAIAKARWIKGAPVKVMMHGFTQSQNSSMPAMIKNAYLERMGKTGEKYNLLVVDWGRLAYSLQDTILPIYTAAVRNVQTAGKRVAEFIIKCFDLGVIIKPEQVHLIGFSLGSHLAGHAGDTFQKRKPEMGKLGRLTGLDPAGPLFYANIPNFNGREMTSRDAQHVDVIHSSWGSYGIAKNIGDADFHPNFALPITVQPKCVDLLGTLKPLQACSHNMCPIYFTMSILRNMESCPCDSFANYIKPLFSCRSLCQKQNNMITFGEDWNPLKIGNYYSEIPKRLFFESPQGSQHSQQQRQTTHNQRHNRNHDNNLRRRRRE